jgi:hypothetical protein
MRAHNITTISPPRRSARRVLALAIGICALAVPTSAAADPIDLNDAPYASPDALVGPPSGESSDSSLSGEAAAVAAGHAHRTPGELAQRTGPGELGLVSSSPASTSDGFDWGSAAMGAGAAMALVALGGAGFLTVRRRTAVSPSAASMS